MVFFYNQVLNKSSGDAAGTAAAAVGQPEASNSSSSSSSRKGPQPTRTSSKKSVQDGARDVCCAALKRVMALKTVTDEVCLKGVVAVFLRVGLCGGLERGGQHVSSTLQPSLSKLATC
eukprot:1161190-Pelagomonas_calceolata.AAC.5